MQDPRPEESRETGPGLEPGNRSDQPEPVLTPAQDAAVRRVLAEARHDEPMPAEVVDRLEAALAALAAVRREEPAVGTAGVPEERGPAPVVDLAARRRRRWSRALVAAAAVVAVGLAGPQLVQQAAQLDSGAGQAGGDSGGGDAGAEGPAAAEVEADTSRSAAQPNPAARPELAGAAPVVREQGFRADAIRVRGLPPTMRSRGLANDDLQGAEEEAAAAEVTACGPGPKDDETEVAVTYRGRRAVVVYTPLDENRELAALFVCGRPDAVRTATVPAP